MFFGVINKLNLLDLLNITFKIDPSSHIYIQKQRKSRKDLPSDKRYDIIYKILSRQGGNNMITINNLSFHFGGQLLFKNVDLKFTPGNCYGIIGANGAGKSTFLRILCGELEPSTGEISIPETVRMSVLRQDHFAFDQYTLIWSM